VSHPRAPRNAAADRAVRFVKNLTHTKGEWAGQPFRLRPWQEHILRRLFGTLLPDGRRQCRTCYVEIPRKNGKSEIAAAIALYMLLGDEENGAEVYSAAVDRDQASLVFKAAEQMVRNDPELTARLEIVPSQRRIVDQATGSFYRAIAADAPSAHGYNASAIIYDELHAAPNRDLWDVLTTSTGARRQPLTFVITTAGYDRQSICWELHDYAAKVRDGVIVDPTFLPILYGAPDAADWLDERVWRAANPALGDFRSLEEMRVAAQQAREVPARQNTFRRLYLCQWTESESRWLDPEAWALCGLDAIDLASLRGRRAIAGLDLSSTSDLTACVLLFADADGGYTVLPRFWLPADNLAARVRRDRVPYDAWARDGFLELTDGNVVDYGRVFDYISGLSGDLGIDLAELAFDPWNATGLVQRFQDAGLTCVAIQQGFKSLTAPTKELERLVSSRKLRHGNHPVLRWCADNVVVEQDAAGNLKPSKRKSTERIDGIVALVTALARAMVQGGPETSIYESRGLLVT
jgi:phage terminase large subunit-like protein